MRTPLFILILTFTVLSCAQAQSLGAGVSIDKQGNLKIDAPLYVIDTTGEKPVLKRAPASMNLPVFAGIPYEDTVEPLEVTGGIIKGRLSLTIKEPVDEYGLMQAAMKWNIPDHLFTSGAEVKIGQLFLAFENVYYHTIGLYPNDHVKFLIEEGYDKKPYYYIGGAFYEHTYSWGEVTISGNVNETKWGGRTWYNKLDIHLKRGWNVILEDEYFDDTLQKKVNARTSSLPSTNAVWVLLSNL